VQAGGDDQQYIGSRVDRLSDVASWRLRTLVKNASRLTPMSAPGIIIGWVKATRQAEGKRRRLRTSWNAAAFPTTTPIAVHPAATAVNSIGAGRLQRGRSPGSGRLPPGWYPSIGALGARPRAHTADGHAQRGTKRRSDVSGGPGFAAAAAAFRRWKPLHRHMPRERRKSRLISC